MPHALSWFEIPVADIARAQRFYETVLGRALRRGSFGDSQLAVFPYAEPATGGCLQQGLGAPAPAGAGVRVYLDCAPSLDAALARVDGAGGHVVLPKFRLPDGMGYIARVRDTEGNEVGLHAETE